MDPRSLNLRALNSATKYPSILTYHEMGEKGRLVEGVPSGLDALDPETEIAVPEKVDGTNARVLVFPGDGGKIYGSREELLGYSGDLLYANTLGIVEGIRALDLAFPRPIGEALTVYYGEVYGGKVGSNAKQYSAFGAVGFCLFDVAVHQREELFPLLCRPLEEISAWREAGRQAWQSFWRMPASSYQVPVRVTLRARELPRTLADTYEWLCQFRRSHAALDGSGLGASEGVIVRTADRSFIRKIRFEDYERTLGLRRTL